MATNATAARGTRGPNVRLLPSLFSTDYKATKQTSLRAPPRRAAGGSTYTAIDFGEEEEKEDNAASAPCLAFNTR